MARLHVRMREEYVCVGVGRVWILHTPGKHYIPRGSVSVEDDFHILRIPVISVKSIHLLDCSPFLLPSLS